MCRITICQKTQEGFFTALLLHRESRSNGQRRKMGYKDRLSASLVKTWRLSQIGRRMLKSKRTVFKHCYKTFTKKKMRRIDLTMNGIDPRELGWFLFLFAPLNRPRLGLCPKKIGPVSRPKKNREIAASKSGFDPLPPKFHMPPKTTMMLLFSLLCQKTVLFGLVFFGLIRRKMRNWPQQ